MTATETTRWSTVVLLLLVVIAGIGLGGDSTAQPPRPECVTSEERISIRASVLAAIDDGLKDHMKFLFVGWIKDPTRQPERASAGLQSAIVAYKRAREDALRWNPAICGEEKNK